MIEQSIFKAYDIRGVYPDQVNDVLAYRIGQAYIKVVNPSRKVAVGMDVRMHSPILKKSVIQGLIDGGVDVVDLGTISTEMLYFAVGFYGYDGGIQVTASHNTAEYNGFKMVKKEALPLSREDGIFEIRDLILEKKEKIESTKKGIIEKKDVLDDFCFYCLKFVDQEKIKPLSVAYNPNFGYSGIVLKRINELASFKFNLYGLNSEPDGSFPKGQPDPFQKENRPEFMDFIKKRDVDFGVAWDADGDRAFFCTKDGDFIEPYFINAVLIERLIKKNNNSGKIIYDPRYTWALIDSAERSGGTAIIEKVGHSYIKKRMREEKAIFAGESSGHSYFKDFWYADSGIVPFLIFAEIVSEDIKIEDILKPLYEKYFISGEINIETPNKNLIIEKIKKVYFDADKNELDGLSIEYHNWRANIRGSNTEPLLRINIEGKNQLVVDKKKKEIIDIINSIK